MKYFAMIGAAGFVAPLHMRAILETGNELVAALDPSDSVGIIDQYFPNASFFTEFERFDRHLEKLRRKNLPIDFLTICSPNYLHDAHIRFGLRHGANVICEKPLVLNPWNVTSLEQLRNETEKKVFNVFQLRLHPAIVSLQKKIEKADPSVIHDIDLTYISARGKWYYTSWKGEVQKSGGIATNIGIHFFDMLIWIFGEVKEVIVHIHTHDRAAGYLQLEKARVKWFLSINEDTIPADKQQSNKRMYRSLSIGGEDIQLNEGFTDLHTASYKEILNGGGFSLMEALPAINLVHRIRNATLTDNNIQAHPLASLPLSSHPFER